MRAIIIINFKTYKQGEAVLKLAKKIERISEDIIIGAQPTDIYFLSKKTKLKIYSQHADYFEPGRNTGFILPEAIKTNGGKGVLLNHSEHKLSFDTLKKTIKRCKKVGLKTAVFASNLKEAQKIEKLRPHYLIIEPPELVAGKISVSQAKPQLIKNLSKKLRMSFLVGAGIHSKEDVEISLKLGAKGIAVSSFVTKARKPEKALKELIRGFKSIMI